MSTPAPDQGTNQPIFALTDRLTRALLARLQAAGEALVAYDFDTAAALLDECAQQAAAHRDQWAALTATARRFAPEALPPAPEPEPEPAVDAPVDPPPAGDDT